MDDNFRNGFEKTAIIGKAIGFVGKKAFGVMPKIFKKFTMKGGKFSPTKAGGSALGLTFGASEVSRVAGEARKASSKPVTKSMIPRSWRA